MDKAVIEVKNLSKLYRLGVVGINTLKDSLEYWWYRIRKKEDLLRKGAIKHKTIKHNDPTLGPYPNTIWALKDVSFSVKKGEIIGIIGRNGAGKTTLLKILSRITEPTSGSAIIRGKISSLLEIGTGFHPELTGRENIFLNGATLGMKKSEIRRKFDEIVSFAEVEEFIDTPVKRYSSGMYTRLAFAVAAHLEPQILLVDEVLAVGDARFYSKCINKIRNLNQQGTTIMVVTHNMWLVQTVCSRVICLHKGCLVAEGSPISVVGIYLNKISKEEKNQVFNLDPNYATFPNKDRVVIQQFQIIPQNNWFNDKEAFPDSTLKVIISIQTKKIENIRFLLRVTTLDGLALFTVYSSLFDVLDGERVECEATIPHLMLMPAEYFVWGAVCSSSGEKEILAAEKIKIIVRNKENQEQEPIFSLFWNQAEWSIKKKNA